MLCRDSCSKTATILPKNHKQCDDISSDTSSENVYAPLCNRDQA